LRARDLLEKWSKKYKSSIDCSHPRGFSQRAHCQGRKKHNEDAEAGTQPTLMDALRDFFPVAMQHLDLDHLPRITFVQDVTGHHAPTFGKFMNAENTIFVDIENRHPNDILRTLAHELVHYRQMMDHQLDDSSGETGSDEENQANAQAGVIMRNFNQQYPEYLELGPVILPAKKTHISESHDATPAQQWSSPEERCKKKISEASDADVERMSQQWVEGYGSEDIAYNALISIREEIVFVLPRYCETYRVACDMRKQMQAMGSEKFHAWIIVTFTQDLAAAGWPRPHSDTFTDLTKRLVFKPLRGGVNPLDTLTEQIEIGKDTPAQQWIHKIYDEFHEHPFNPRYRVMTWGSGDDQQLAIFELAPVFGKPTTVDIKWFQAYPQRQGIGTRAMQRLQQLALEHGITLTIYPWNRGEVSQSKLTKIYRGMGFRPTARGVKDMSWQPQQQSLSETFDQPYPLTWEHSEYGDVDALATLDDGTHLTVMFSKQDDDSWGVSFYRNDSQRTTGLGDAHRVFATVLAAIAEFVKKQQPRALTFSAVKVEEDDDSIQDQLSRIKLYDRMVERYARSAGYGVTRVDKTHLVAYKLTRLKQELSEQQHQDYMAGHCHVMAIALKLLHPDWQIRAHIGWDDDEAEDHEYRVDHVYIVAPDGSAYDCRGRFDNEDQLVGPDTTGGIDTQYVDLEVTDIKQLIARGELKQFTKQDIVHATEFAKQNVNENFKDGRHPEDKGDSKRYGVPTRASVSTLRKVAKQGGRRGQLAHWMANMKAGRAKAKK